jgi:hypothetical protein
MSNVLLGNVAVPAYADATVTSGNMSYDLAVGPVDSSNTSTMPITLPVEGGVLYDLPLERLEDPGVPPPTEDKNDTGTGNKKNLLLFGIGGLVLAYLLFRKK